MSYTDTLLDVVHIYRDLKIYDYTSAKLKYERSREFLTFNKDFYFTSSLNSDKLKQKDKIVCAHKSPSTYEPLIIICIPTRNVSEFK
jgi:hypothetical protein